MNPIPRTNHSLLLRITGFFVHAADFWRRHLALRYAFALGATLVATLLQFAVESFLGPVTPPFLVFYPMVMMVALVAGFGPAVFATLMSIGALWVLPLNGSPASGVEFPRMLLVIFGVMGCLLGAAAELLGRVRSQLDLARREAAFRESEERFHHIADAMPQLVWSAKRDGSVIYYNSRSVEYHGIEVTQDENWKWQPTVHPEDLQMTIDTWETAVREGSIYQLEHRLRMADNSFRWHLSRAFLAESRNGGKEWIGTATDIDDMKSAQAALKESEGLYRGIGESINYGVWVCDPDGRNVYASESFLKLVGLTQQECSEFGWGDVLHPDDAEATINAWKECVKTSGNWDRQHRFKGVDGKWHHVLARGVPVRDSQGKVTCWAGINLDIDRLKEVEEALRVERERLSVALDAGEMGVYDFDIISDELWWSPGVYRVFGVNPETFIPTRDAIMSLIHPEDRQRVWDHMEETIRKHEPFVDEFRTLLDDGSLRWVANRAVTQFDAEGRPVRNYGVAIDITDRKRTEDALNEEARRKDEFLAMLSHELRNPLNAIRNAVMVSKEAISNPDARRMAGEVIDRQSRQLGRMVDDLLDVARVNRGRIELKLEPQDLGAVLRHAIAATWPLIEERRHALQTEIEPGLSVSGDPTRLEQVFVNLINNATKYTSEGGVIRLSAMRDGNDAVVSIQDNGMGISAELLPHVFDLFRQADSSLDRSQGGLGIGLSVVKTLVARHQGQIVVESPGPNAGTTVTVRLPLLQHAKRGTEPASGWVQDSAKPETRVLIVDDHVDSAQVLEMLLEMHGFKVRLAHSGPDGLQAAREFAPEVLLLDLGLPGFDGFELVKMLREEPACAGSLFIAVSGYARVADRQRCLDAGFHHHCAKPVDISVLLEAIHSRPIP